MNVSKKVDANSKRSTHQLKNRIKREDKPESVAVAVVVVKASSFRFDQRTITNNEQSKQSAVDNQKSSQARKTKTRKWTKSEEFLAFLYYTKTGGVWWNPDPVSKIDDENQGFSAFSLRIGGIEEEIWRAKITKQGGVEYLEARESR